MSEQEQPERRARGAAITVDDVRQLMGASTPHFALQLRGRIRALIAPLDAGHPARLEGEREIARLDRIAFTGEIRGEPAQEGMAPLASLDESAPHVAPALRPPRR